MLRIRDINGQAQEIQDQFRFIELCDLEGRVAILFYRDDAGVIHTVRHGDPQATKYAATMGIEFCPTQSR